MALNVTESSEAERAAVIAWLLDQPFGQALELLALAGWSTTLRVPAGTMPLVGEAHGIMLLSPNGANLCVQEAIDGRFSIESRPADIGPGNEA